MSKTREEGFVLMVSHLFLRGVNVGSAKGSGVAVWVRRR